MYKLIIFVHCLLYQFADSYTTYDQRQDGPWNLEIDVKNVNIFAITKGNKEEYVDYDYAYDYSEMTIKPPHGTKPKPINSTITSTEIPPKNTTEASTDKIISTTIEADVTTFSPTNDTLVTVLTNTTLVPNSTAAATTTPTSTCKKGYVQNSNGHCELELQGTSNALRTLVKLSQKLKWRRANRHNHQDSV